MLVLYQPISSPMMTRIFGLRGAQAIWHIRAPWGCGLENLPGRSPTPHSEIRLVLEGAHIVG